MKALVFEGYGPASSLRVTEREAPGTDAGRILVRVAAASPNPIDWHLYRGEPWVLRLRRGASSGIVGEDFAGLVEHVGPGVQEYRAGQRVFGTLPAGIPGIGSIAEFVSVDPQWVAPLPDCVTMPEGGAIGLGALTALQALRRCGVRDGSRVLIWGAGGGVGHLAVRIAGLLGAARVDAVCSSQSRAEVLSMGASRVFDYTANESPTGPYDAIVDTVCTAGIGQIRRLLAPGGAVVTIGALGGGRLFGPGTPMLRRGILARLSGIRAFTLMTRVTTEDLRVLGEWMATGQLSPRLAEEFALAEAPEAFARLEGGRVHGKLSIRVR